MMTVTWIACKCRTRVDCEKKIFVCVKGGKRQEFLLTYVSYISTL